MTDVNTTLPPALSRALNLLVDPPAEPDVHKGYLDLLGTPAAEDSDLAKNTGLVQAAWASSIGSMLYDNAQAITRKLFATWMDPIGWLNIPPGGVALDVGSGPGSVTASLARAAGPDGLALGGGHLRTHVGPRGTRRSGSTGRLPACRCTTAAAA
jgi:hypothetical protein